MIFQILNACFLYVLYPCKHLEALSRKEAAKKFESEICCLVDLGTSGKKDSSAFKHSSSSLCRVWSSINTHIEGLPGRGLLVHGLPSCLSFTFCAVAKVTYLQSLECSRLPVHEKKAWVEEALLGHLC